VTADVEIALCRLKWGTRSKTMIGEILAIPRPKVDDVQLSAAYSRRSRKHIESCAEKKKKETGRSLEK
jgi:hypothetical protein